MTELAIRALAPADQPAWGMLRDALWPDHGPGELEAKLPAAIAAGLVGFGAFAGPTLVGFAEADVRSYGDGCETAPVAWLEGIYVLPAYRRQGVARRLVAQVEAWARAVGYRELGSDAVLDNVVSRLGHARWGFAETGRIVTFRKELA